MSIETYSLNYNKNLNLSNKVIFKKIQYFFLYFKIY